MTLQQLEYYLAAVRLGSFSAAADELHLAQPSLSEQVRRLEAELGVRLFQRVGRGLTPTEAGRALRPHAERALAEVEAARESVRAVRELRGGIATFPLPDVGVFRRMQIGADFFAFAKYDRDAPIDEPTGTERFLGWEPDVYLNWQVTSDVTLALRYGVFFPSERNFATDETRQFFFAGVTFAF